MSSGADPDQTVMSRSLDDLRMTTKSDKNPFYLCDRPKAVFGRGTFEICPVRTIDCSNLRGATVMENSANMTLSRDNTSMPGGTSW